MNILRSFRVVYGIQNVSSSASKYCRIPAICKQVCQRNLMNTSSLGVLEQKCTLPLVSARFLSRKTDKPDASTGSHEGKVKLADGRWVKPEEIEYEEAEPIQKTGKSFGDEFAAAQKSRLLAYTWGFAMVFAVAVWWFAKQQKVLWSVDRERMIEEENENKNKSPDKRKV